MCLYTLRTLLRGRAVAGGPRGCGPIVNDGVGLFM